MKVLAIIAGRRRQNSEYWAQTALAGAEAAGAEVELINLRDLDIKPCTGCIRCHLERDMGKRGGCHMKDDMSWLDEKILECDGMIVVSPCYENSPPSELKLFCDRLGPSHDVVMLKAAHDAFIAKGEPGYDERWFKRRPCAFISHGGSEWTTLGLPILSIIAVPLGMKIVDLLNYSFTNSCILDPKKSERVRELGRAVAENCGRAEEDMFFNGDPGHCPVCHNSVMVLGENANEVTCSVCGMTGTLSVVDGKIKVSYAPEEFEKSHVTDSGKYLHMLDLQGKGCIEMQQGPEGYAKVAEIVKAGTSRYKSVKPER